jgi:hypothetical protein
VRFEFEAQRSEIGVPPSLRLARRFLAGRMGFAWTSFKKLTWKVFAYMSICVL